jgi:tripartite-type tricarboxylate transporter receptor subunit TctC
MNSMFKASALCRVLVTGALLSAFGAAVAQQDFPNKPIRIVVPYAPGGATSVLGRLVGEKMTQAWGQPVLVDNRPGGNTVIGSEIVAKADPNGYTLLLMTSTHVINAVLLPNTPYDAINDFAPVATLAGAELILVVNSKVPAKNLKELIALAKTGSTRLNYASSGNGGTMHLAGEYFNMLAGVKTTQIPYKGTGPVIPALMGGEIQMTITPPAVFIPAIKAGKIRALAVTGTSRLAALPDIPTFAEAGLPTYELKGWYGLLAPAATPKPVINKLSAEIAKILAIAEIEQFLVKQEMAPYINSADQFALLIKSELAKFKAIVKAADIKAGT